MIVIADTTPLNYLVLIGSIDVLPALYGRVVIPLAVRDELQQSRTPELVRQWMAQPPSWLEPRPPRQPIDPALTHLDAGERDAIALALELYADLLLIDDKEGKQEAARRDLAVAGTLAVIEKAADRDLLDFSTALDRLRQTSFRLSQEVEQAFLKRRPPKKEPG